MPKFRSPVLGFNHNIRHKGWLFHVQTEDSGIQNPHIFTHLFREGVILASKKVEYDAEASMEVVKGLMQAQHKSVMKQLKGGVFDEKIRQYLGDAPPDAEDTPVPAAAPVKEAPASPVVDDDADVSGVFRRMSEPPIPHLDPPTPPPTAPKGAPGTAGAWVISRPGRAERPFDKSGQQPMVRAPTVPTNAIPEVPQGQAAGVKKKPTTPGGQSPVVPPSVSQSATALPSPGSPRRPTPPVQHGRQSGQMPIVPPAQPAVPRKSPAMGRSQETSSVVVARPAVVIGAPPTVIGGPAPAPASASASAAAQASGPSGDAAKRTANHARETTPPAPSPENIFGQDLISEKSLDEVIMAYLSEDSSEE